MASTDAVDLLPEAVDTACAADDASAAAAACVLDLVVGPTSGGVFLPPLLNRASPYRPAVAPRRRPLLQLPTLLSRLRPPSRSDVIVPAPHRHCFWFITSRILPAFHRQHVQVEQYEGNRSDDAVVSKSVL